MNAKYCCPFVVLLTLNAKERYVQVEHVGNNPSAVNGVTLGKGEKRKVYHNDIVEVLASNYFYKVEFPPVDELPPAKKVVNNGSLDCFLKDAVLEPIGSWKKIDQDRLVVFTSRNVKSKEKVSTGTLRLCKSFGNKQISKNVSSFRRSLRSTWTEH